MDYFWYATVGIIYMGKRGNSPFRPDKISRDSAGMTERTNDVD